MGCLFCDIISGKIKTEIILETDDLFAFRDINPQSPLHLLVVPKKHLENIDSASSEDVVLLGRLLLASKDIAEIEKLSNGYRIVINCGSDAGQAVKHLHIHILGGRKLGWPPG